MSPAGSPSGTEREKNGEKEKKNKRKKEERGQKNTEKRSGNEQNKKRTRKRKLKRNKRLLFLIIFSGRLYMSIPFVGKDVPSTSSEFAHPDIAIGLFYYSFRVETRTNERQQKQQRNR